MGSRRRSTAILVGFIAALTIASSAAGASSWLSIRQNGVSAIAQRLDCIDNGDNTLSCEAELLAAFKGTIKITGSSTIHTDQVCYERLTATLDASTGDVLEGSAVAGCAFDSGKVRVRSLGSIVVGATGVDLVSLTCDDTGCSEEPAGQVTIRGTWSSAGRPMVSRLKFRFDDGICTDVLATQGRVREARFAGSVDGTRLRSDIALVGAGIFRIKTRCLGGLPL
jgi:hypothetical protein